MANLKIPNLCGASLEFNAIQEQFESLIDDTVGSLEAEASTLASSATSAFSDLESKVRSLVPEIPSLPDVNLQSQLSSLSSLVPGSSQHTQLLSTIKTSFDTELSASGFSLDTLVSSAQSAIGGGGDLCSVVPNFTKPADGSGPAVEKAIESKQATVDSEEEKPSTIVKNDVLVAEKAEVEAKVKKMQVEESTDVDVVSGTVTSTKIPATDTGVFTVTKESEEVTYTSTTVISGGGSTVTTRAKEVTPPNKQKGKNLTHSGGFTRIKVTEIQEFGEDDLELGIAFDGHVHMLELESEPIGGLLIYANIKVTRNGKTYDSDGNRIPGFHPVKHQRMIQCHDGADIGKVGNVPRSHQLNYGRKNPYYTVEGKTVTVFENGNVIFDHVQDPELRGYKKRYDGVAILVKNRIFGEYDASKTDKLE